MLHKIPPAYPIPINLGIARNWRSWGKPQSTATFESRVRICAAIAPLSVSALLAQHCLLGQWKTSFQMDMFVWGTYVYVFSVERATQAMLMRGESRSGATNCDLMSNASSPRRGCTMLHHAASNVNVNKYTVTFSMLPWPPGTLFAMLWWLEAAELLWS